MKKNEKFLKKEKMCLTLFGAGCIFSITVATDSCGSEKVLRHFREGNKLTI